MRETWAAPVNWNDFAPKDIPEWVGCWWLADDNRPVSEEELPWRPSIHMPRWASRITLRVTGVRVERLQEISEKDAIAEGVRGFVEDGCFVYEDYVHGRGTWTMSARDSFATLWESINGPESWAANPWVWVVEFEKEGA